MITVVDIDEHNNVVSKAQHSEITLATDDIITMRPGVPRLGTPEFDRYLREWHEINNARNIYAVTAR